MIEYNWSTASEPTQDELPREHLPTRFALTMVAVVRRGTESNRAILLCNPHPESWNNWLLPYGSLQVNLTGPFEGGRRIGDVSEILKNLREHRLAEYRQAATSGITEMLGVDMPLARGAFFENFAIKFSKTANVWTAYAFAYHLSSKIETLSPSCQAADLPLDAASVTRVLRDGKLDGLRVAENVVALISVHENLALIRG